MRYDFFSVWIKRIQRRLHQAVRADKTQEDIFKHPVLFLYFLNKDFCIKSQFNTQSIKIVEIHNKIRNLDMLRSINIRLHARFWMTNCFKQTCIF